jgi:hypothetical protein
MMMLTADESRVLGVLVEKALTTPDPYPLSLNAIVNGGNQKNNRYSVFILLCGHKEGHPCFLRMRRSGFGAACPSLARGSLFLTFL